jgi:hypothetical protein
MSPRLSLDPVAERVEEDEHVNLQGGGEGNNKLNHPFVSFFGVR